MTPIFAIIDAPIIAVILGLAVLLFGADRIPKLARSMGEAKREFETASRPGPPDAGSAPPPPPAPGPPPQPPNQA
ncbi:MAG TPA: twin-arginine translocase TatA/TatE family subunit, partial [Candidatus Eremiobacteraceae bacterium]|nr:twin-arginine translocase TatA/TatE family subunit [Candidatus Eremiobacteraceae bacterium]